MEYRVLIQKEHFNSEIGETFRFVKYHKTVCEHVWVEIDGGRVGSVKGSILKKVGQWWNDEVDGDLFEDEKYYKWFKVENCLIYPNIPLARVIYE